MKATLSLSLLALAGSAAAKLPSIEVKGSKFFFPNGTQFFMKGVAYQREVGAAGADSSASSSSSTKKYQDPLADAKACKRDIPLLAELGTNVIRTYAIDPKEDHSECMKLLDEHNIYVVSDLSEPVLSINRDDPQWNTELFDRYKAVIDEMGKYSNVIGFFAGNEVSNNATNTPASAYVKAAVRDSKKYIKSKGGRWMGVGYAANDDKDIRQEIADYFNCGDPEDSIDFWGYNIYSWCGKNTMQGSGYSDQVKFFKDYNVPVFFAEYGCNLPDGAEGRIFEETDALYNNQEMTDVFSGGIVYMYFQEANDYGLVKVTGNTAKKMKNFSALKKQVLKADPKGVEKDSYKPSASAAKCPSTDKKNWQAAEQLPPTPDKTLCKCMVDSLSCVPSDDLSEKSFGKLFGAVCGENPAVCDGITGNTTLGNFGAYSMCSPAEKLAFVLDSYYKKQNKASDACSWKGQAKVQKGNTASSCEKSLKSAEQKNQEVSSANKDGKSVSGGSSGSGDDKENAGSRFQMSGIATAAALLAMGMIAL